MGHFAYINLATAICCFLFSVFLSIIYFTKKNMNNIENKIYRHLLILNDIELLVSLIYDVLAIKNNYSALYVMIRVYAASSSAYLFCLFFYILVVSTEHNEKLYKVFNKNISFIVFYAIITILSVLYLLYH